MTRTTPAKNDRDAQAVKQVRQAIRAGRLDGADVVNIWQDCNEALVAREAGERWRIDESALGVQFTEDDMTLRDAIDIEARIGRRPEHWQDFLKDPALYEAVLFVWLTNHQGMEAVEASRLTGDIPVNAAADSITRAAVSPDPKERPAA